MSAAMSNDIKLNFVAVKLYHTEIQNYSSQCNQEFSGI